MYINLGKINLQYVNENPKDWMIIAQIVESGMSFDRPQLVRSVDELDIWFGKEFESYNYLKELLLMGVTLYLYKPISTLANSSENTGFVNLRKYQIPPQDINIYEYDIEWLEKLKNNPTLYKFKVLDPMGDIVVSGNNKEFICTWGNLGGDLSKQVDLGIILDRDGGDTGTLTVKQVENYLLLDEILVRVNGSDFYIWQNTGEEYYLENLSDLNQNSCLSSDSLNNRDTLLITTVEHETLDCIHPEYLTGEEHLGNFSKTCEELTLSETPDLNTDSLNNGYQTGGFRVKKTGEDVKGYMIIPRTSTTPFKKEGWYLTLINTSGIITDNNKNEIARTLPFKNQDLDEPLFKYEGNGKNPDGTGNVDLSWYKFEDKGDIYFYGLKFSDIAGFFEILDYEVEIEDENNFTVYSPVPVPNLYYHKMEGIEITPLIKESNLMLFNSISEKDIAAEFWSKTIGRCSELDDDEKIKVRIEIDEDDKDSENYRITISRFNYSETFIGPVISTFGTERLDYKITKESKLVSCVFNNKKLRTGEYVLIGAKKEYPTREMYLESMKPMFDIQEIPVYFDYFLIPDIHKYIKRDVPGDTTYFPEYKTFLDYAKSINCQFLIQNHSIDYLKEQVVSINKRPSVENAKPGIIYCYTNSKPLGGMWDKNYVVLEGNELESVTEYYTKGIVDDGDYIFNYIEDKDNHLVYFLDNIYLGNKRRPGYYAYLRGLLLGKFSISEKDFRYNPISTDPYQKFSIETKLENYKCNYLVCNNQKYFYKKYFNGKKCNTTAWMRFVIGKIYREIEKSRGEIISSKIIGNVRRTIDSVLGDIQTSFSIVKSISVTDFDYRPRQNSLFLSIDTYVNELVDNNIKLDITINYNTY